MKLRIAALLGLCSPLAVFAADMPAAGVPQPSLMQQFLPLVIVIAVFYFLLIRPQMKRNKEHRNMLAAIAPGDEVVTNGGLLGRIAKLSDDFIQLTVADDVQISVQKSAIASVMPKGTLESA